MKEYELIVVGAGPAGLSAAIEFSKYSNSVLLIDENKLPGGQLFKQTHKFFGSGMHNAGMRGNAIGKMLLEEAEKRQIEIMLDSRVWGIFEDQTIAVKSSDANQRMKYKYLLLATGAVENAVSFPGCTLPGIMTAGAAQTLMNVQRVQPGSRAVVLGSGNVGLIVAYQLVQAGVKVEAVVDIAQHISGYGVHAAKIKRLGIPFFLGYTIKQAAGNEYLEKLILEKQSSEVSGPETVEMDADLLCISAGLVPRLELAVLANCKLGEERALGGQLPVHNRYMQTSVHNVFSAGDLSGVEEASTALDEGRMAGNAIAWCLKKISDEEMKKREAEISKRLSELRGGQFGQGRMSAKESIWKKFQEVDEVGA